MIEKSKLSKTLKLNFIGSKLNINKFARKLKIKVKEKEKLKLQKVESVVIIIRKKFHKLIKDGDKLKSKYKK